MVGTGVLNLPYAMSHLGCMLLGKSLGYGGAPTVTLQLADGIQLSVELDVDYYSYSAKINLGVVFDFFTLRDVDFAYGGYNVV
ncbi:hypothetical protein KY284_011409 [Solanum tuberosum]|nr:hypothetical protein KY284_011409 [Solanum tuberosum]